MQKESNNGIPAFYAKTRMHWRTWLEKNCRKKKEICLILFHKASKVKSVTYAEAIEEALCFGWIDSRKDKRDPESSYQRFSPRKPNSNWSESNKERVGRMIKEGKMTEDGQRMVDLAKENGRWQ